MERDLLEPQSFDPARSEAPPLSVTPGGEPGVVLLVVAPAAAGHEWTEQSAAALAAGWADQSRRILLADFALTRPGLHRVLGVANGEGVSDAFLFGSSLQRVAHPVEGGRFLFVSAGTVTARPEAVTSSPRWEAVVEACVRVRATLVAFLPWDLPGSEALLDQASDVVLLTGPGAVHHEVVANGLGERLRAVLVPPDASPSADGVGRASEDEGDTISTAASGGPDSGGEVDRQEEPTPGGRVTLGGSPADEPEEWTAPPPVMSDGQQESADVALVFGDGGPEEAVMEAPEGRPPALEAEAASGESAEVGEPLAPDASPVEDEAALSGAVFEGLELEDIPDEAKESRDEADLDPFPDLVSARDPLLPEPVTPDDEQAPAAVFDLSGFDGLLEEPQVESRPGPALDPEEEPGAPSPLPASTVEAEPEGFDLRGAVPQEVGPAPASVPPPREAPHPRQPARGAGAAAGNEAPPSRPPPRRTGSPTRPRPASRPPARTTGNRTGLLLGVLVVVVVIAIALAWIGLIELPWLSPWLAGRGTETAWSWSSHAFLVSSIVHRRAFGDGLIEHGDRDVA